MNQDRADGAGELDWKLIEDEMLERVKYVARRIVERVRRVTDGVPARRVGPDDPTDEVPAFG
ncbi:MAG TPA: hypothetical protein VH092_12095 [Urbifossiella sp.]|jgi:hypothetical protein|nr:hypothetical protein [Urbifossiella sp.]